MDFMTMAKRRCAVRGYLDKAVEEEKLARLVQAARVAPTAGNCQPVRLITVQTSEGLAKVGKAAELYGAPLAIVVCADHSKAWTRPFDGKQTCDIDASILTDHMMLQATELGLGSVWICYFQPEVLRRELDLPEDLEPINILAVGYSDQFPGDPSRFDRTRIPAEELVWKTL